MSDVGQLETPPVAATPADERPRAVILRERVRWPAPFTLTKPLRVQLIENGAVIGESLLEPGRTLRATVLTDAGMLKAWLGDREIEVPYEDTDFVHRAASASPPLDATTSPSATASQASPFVPTRIQKQSGDPEQRLLALKAKFPAMRTETVHYPKKPGSQTIEVPHVDIYSYYKGMVQTATLQGLPVSLQRMETRIESDLSQLHSETASLNNKINAAQASRTITWINGTLRPYLAQLKAIADGR